MSKYIDADLYVEMQIYDDEHEEWGLWNGTIEDLLNQWTEEGCPTPIEVSEDCISKHDIWKIIEDNAYWVRYNENSTEKGMTLTGINQALNECPPVIPTVSEDCISREYLKSFEYINKGDFNSVETIREWIDNAPSVVPTQTNTNQRVESVGRWAHYMGDLWTCTACGEGFMCDDIECNNYCPNCGAKMKG